LELETGALNLKLSQPCQADDEIVRRVFSAKPKLGVLGHGGRGCHQLLKALAHFLMRETFNFL
jgi:hypothetical protein